MIFLCSVSKAFFSEDLHRVILHRLERMSSGVGRGTVSSACSLQSCHQTCLTRLCLGQCQGTYTDGEYLSDTPYSSSWRWCSTGQFPHPWPSHVFKLRILSPGDNVVIEDSGHLAGAGSFIADRNFTEVQTLRSILWTLSVGMMAFLSYQYGSYLHRKNMSISLTPLFVLKLLLLNLIVADVKDRYLILQ